MHENNDYILTYVMLVFQSCFVNKIIFYSKCNKILPVLIVMIRKFSIILFQKYHYLNAYIRTETFSTLCMKVTCYNESIRKIICRLQDYAFSHQTISLALSNPFLPNIRIANKQPYTIISGHFIENNFNNN